MQLRADHVPPLDDRWDEPATPAPFSPAMREYEARRCHVCQCKYPSFGIGPPLTPAGKTLWSCMTHRDELNRLVSSATPRPAEKKQPASFDL